MYKIKTENFPIKGFKAMTIFPFIFIRKDINYLDVDNNHEEIHGRQIVELTVLATIVVTFFRLDIYYYILPYFTFYILFGINYIINLLRYNNKRLAYKNIIFETEARIKSKEHNYLIARIPFSWLKYLKHKK